MTCPDGWRSVMRSRRWCPISAAGCIAAGTTPRPRSMSALTNVVFMILFALWADESRAVRPGLFVRITLACFLLNLYWFVKAWREDGLKDLLVGLLRVAGRRSRCCSPVADPHRLRKPSNIENTHGRHAIMSATLRFSRLGQVTVELRELVEIRGEPRELALQHHGATPRTARPSGNAALRPAPGSSSA